MYTTQSKMISRAIWVEKKHVWKINLQKNGVRKSFYSSVPGDKGRKICAQNATSWLSGACPFSVSERTTVDTVFERYLQDKALETTNIYTIRNRYNNHIKPIIGKVPVMLLTKQDLKRVIYTAYRKHNLSQKSLKNIRGDLSGFCNYLDCADIRNDLRTSNIKIPSNAKKGQKQALDVSSLNILFTESQVPYNGTICQDSLIYAYRFQVVTGLRPGELMGLEWGDIDNDYIHIRRAINAKGITTNGKNEFAARDFPQTRYTRMLLESQQVYRVTPLDPHERVFGSTGQLCYRKRWGIYCRYNGIPYITPYELRHTFSSIYKNHFSNWVYEELVGHTHPGVNGVYEAPLLVKANRDGNIQQLTFSLKGCPLEYWEDNRTTIESALNVTVLSITQGSNNQLFDLRVVAGCNLMGRLIPWADTYMDDSGTKIVLGINAAGIPVSIDFSQLPHWLLAAATGMGKTQLALLILYQLSQKGYDIYLADYKGVDFGPEYRKTGHYADDDAALEQMLDSVVHELNHRRTEFSIAGCANLEEYVQTTGEELHRIVVILDETSMILDTTGRDKDGKAVVASITNKLLAIGRLGRALGIHLLVATQRPDVGSVPGSLKAQLDGRICGHTADAQSSIVILDDGSAAKLPAIPGRFIIRNGSGSDEIIQAYYYHQ